MSYITLQGLIDRYGETELVQLTDALGDGQIDSVKVDRAIADADAEIDAYLSSRMTLPLASVPPVLERIAGVMVRYYLYNDAPTDLVQKQYDAAIAFLRAVARGDASLGPDASGNPTPETGAPSWSSTESVFNADSLSGF